MSRKKIFKCSFLLVLFMSVLVLPQPVVGETGVCGSSVTVASGDTLSRYRTAVPRSML